MQPRRLRSLSTDVVPCPENLEWIELKSEGFAKTVAENLIHQVRINSK